MLKMPKKRSLSKKLPESIKSPKTSTSRPGKMDYTENTLCDENPLSDAMTIPEKTHPITSNNSLSFISKLMSNVTNFLPVNSNPSPLI